MEPTKTLPSDNILYHTSLPNGLIFCYISISLCYRLREGQPLVTQATFLQRSENRKLLPKSNHGLGLAYLTRNLMFT